jgi:hypothetical protein
VALTKSPQPDHTVVVHTPGTPDVVGFLTSPLGSGIVASVIVSIIIVSIAKHLPKWVIAVLVVVLLLAAGIIAVNPRAVRG